MIFLGLGSNLSSKFGDRFANINLAISYLEKNNIEHFLDGGCGSGILILAALKLGAKNGTAFDIDPEAAKNAKKLLYSNRVNKRAKVINETLNKKYLELLIGKIDFITANIFLTPLK